MLRDLQGIYKTAEVYHIVSNIIKCEEFFVFGNGTAWTIKSHAKHIFFFFWLSIFIMFCLLEKAQAPKAPRIYWTTFKN